MRIAVYGGTFDPLHIGHLAILEYLSSSPLFDWTYLVISPQNPFKGESASRSSRRRLAEAKKALRRHPHLKAAVEEIEFMMPQPSYTVETLDALRLREPDNSFTLVVGADNLSLMRGWKDYERILTEYGIAVYPRPGYDMDADMKSLMDECPDYRITLLDARTVDISSTEIRRAVSEGKDVGEVLM